MAPTNDVPACATRRPPELGPPFPRGVTYDSCIANASTTQRHREHHTATHSALGTFIFLPPHAAKTPCAARVAGEYIIYDHRQCYPEYIITYRPG